MKRIVTIDSVISGIFSLTAYVFGYFIPLQMGVNVLLSTVICLVVGIVVDGLIAKLVFNRYIQTSLYRRIGLLLILSVGYYLLHLASLCFFDYSLIGSIFEGLGYTVIIPIIGYGISHGIRFYKKRKIQSKYGTGEKGFFFTLKEKQLFREFNKENKPFHGFYAIALSAKTKNGVFIGQKKRNVLHFLGIPYAKATRWKAPVAPAPSQAVFEAYHFGASDIQPPNEHNLLMVHRQSENCLFLNIWKNIKCDKEQKPVFVHIHGGDGRYGGSALPFYHLENLAKKIPEAIFVSFNFRLGIFGAIDFSLADDAKDFEDANALSLLDQIQALRWIKENIEAFGGDPNHVCLVGDTEGAAYISLLAVMPEAKGLFKKALLVSGNPSYMSLDPTPARKLGELLLKENNATSVKELLDLPSEVLRGFTVKHYLEIESTPCGSKHVPCDVYTAYAQGVAKEIEFIIGFGSDDISSWRAMMKDTVNFDIFANVMFERTCQDIPEKNKEKIQAILQRRINTGLTPTLAKFSLMADILFKTSTLHFCKALKTGGATVRCFYWDTTPQVEKFTSNSIAILNSFLGNNEQAESVGYVNAKDLQEVSQLFLKKFLLNEPLELYDNEIVGVDKVLWPPFPDVLRVTENCSELTAELFKGDIEELEPIVFPEIRL